MAAVAFDRINKVFENGFVAVRNLDLDIADGEFLVLVGPSGSGKTTALRMIAGLELPSSGRVRIGARDVTDVAPKDRDVAMVFQNYALYPHMTVRENLAFGLRMRKTPKPEIEKRVNGVAETLGLEALLSRKPAALSGGQRQRVALGRAIVREPQVFLFDEPLSNLDAKLRVRTRGELVRLHRQLGTTMVYVTHDQTEAMTMGQRIAVLADGELQQVAPPLAVYDRPANAFVAGFIGSPPMNFFEGRISGEPGAMRFEGRSFGVDLGRVAGDGGATLLGIRPEHLTLAPSDDAADLRVSVQVVEPLGSETLVYGKTGQGEDVGIRTEARLGIQPEDMVGLSIKRQFIHLFDRGSGARLEKPA